MRKFANGLNSRKENRMSLRIIEVSKGVKPEGNVMKFGGTGEYDFYVASSGDVMRTCDTQYFIKKFSRITSHKNFEFSAEVDRFRRSIT